MSEGDGVSFEQYRKAVAVVLPDAAIESLDDGELVIYTGQTLTDDEKFVRSMTIEELINP